MTCGSFIRSSLSSVENLLIPKGLRLHGNNSQTALSQYGLVQGMVMPLLFFPASFAGSLCTLLVPELARAASEKDGRFIRRTAERAMRLTLLFSFLTMACFLALSDALCQLFYRSTEAGNLLRIMAPIVPILYLDNVVDGMLRDWISRCTPSNTICRFSSAHSFPLSSPPPLGNCRIYQCVVFQRNLQRNSQYQPSAESHETPPSSAPVAGASCSRRFDSVWNSAFYS